MPFTLRVLRSRSLDTREDVTAVHDVRFTIDDPTTIKPRREQVARINVNRSCRTLVVLFVVGYS